MTWESSIWDVDYSTPQAVYPMLFVERVAPMHLFHLAPDGVCLATDITADAGMLLPHRFTLTPIAGCNLFSVALAVKLPCPDVIRHRYPMEYGLSSISTRPTAIPLVNPDNLLYRGLCPVGRFRVMD